MKKLIFFVTTVLLLFSCTSNTVYEKPKDLISKDSMVILLKDLYLANGARSIKNKRQQRKISYLPLVYKKYKIDSARFQRSNVYYTSKTDEYSSLLQEVLTILQSEQKIFLEKNKIRDSIYRDSIKKTRILEEIPKPKLPKK